MNWQLNKIQYPVYNLGEGKRIGIWVQGCTLACDGCINEMIWTKKKGKAVAIYDLYQYIDSISEDFDGITISGGEPFQQYEQLIAFSYLIKTRTKLNIHCFTGYEIKELEDLFPDKLFLQYIDSLVDGRYLKELHSNNNLVGSSNQKTYRIKNGKAKLSTRQKGINKWSLSVTKDGTIYMAGIPKEKEIETIENRLSNVGFPKKFK
ncbi:MAG: 4Fe-4S single cluster domain-containing protein [Bacteroidota bacterium]